MSADNAGSNNDKRGTGVSLFRAGKSLPAQPFPQDLSHDRDARASRLPPIFANPAKVWDSLSATSLRPAILAQNGIFLEASDHPAAVAFDILRTRLLHGLAEKDWHRIAVTSPTHGCGKSFVATNLALSLARRPSSRTVLVDLDLRHPEIARLLGVDEDRPLAEYLSGDQPLESNFRRYGRTLALGLNSTPIERASEALHDPNTFDALAGIIDQLAPEVVIYDLPPVLVSDDVLAMAPSVDAVLLVTDGTKSSPEEIRAAEKMLEGRIPLLGVVLNRAQDFNAGRYRYAKK
jgi:protein-tyrosine kinase